MIVFHMSISHFYILYSYVNVISYFNSYPANVENMVSSS